MALVNPLRERLLARTSLGFALLNCGDDVLVPVLAPEIDNDLETRIARLRLGPRRPYLLCDPLELFLTETGYCSTSPLTPRRQSREWFVAPRLRRCCLVGAPSGRCFDRWGWLWICKVARTIARGALREAVRTNVMSHRCRARLDEYLLGPPAAITKGRSPRRRHQSVAVFPLALVAHHHIDHCSRLGEPRAALERLPTSLAIHVGIRAGAGVRREHFRLALGPVSRSRHFCPPASFGKGTTPQLPSPGNDRAFASVKPGQDLTHTSRGAYTPSVRQAAFPRPRWMGRTQGQRI